MRERPPDGLHHSERALLLGRVRRVRARRLHSLTLTLTLALALALTQALTLALALALTLALTLFLTVHPNLAGFTVNVFSWEQATGCLDNPKWSFTQMIVLILCVLQLFGLW